jgi:putative oxygen-independent coproporphyrinogen III oxidase
MTVSAYVHIPFCSHKCDFCDFAAFAGLDHLSGDYCRIVESEIERRMQETPVCERLGSVFYGGGTPGLIEPALLKVVHDKLMQNLIPAEAVEITLETTPHSITLEKAKSWMAMGVNRLSIGIESFSDAELQAIGRDHTRAQAYAGVENVIATGFTNVSIDLMYALPTQTLTGWKESLSGLFALANQYPQIKHFSAYGLQLAQNSPLFSRFPKTSPDYPSDDLYGQMYDLLVAEAAEAGFEQYEVSNFSRPGFQSRHNLSYWNNDEYLAFGVSAHRYQNGVRSSNWRSLSKYMADPLGSEIYEVITPAMRLSECIMLGLRKRAGIDLVAFESEFGFRLQEQKQKALARLIEGGFISLADNRLFLTQKGVPVSNSVIAELI